MSSYESLTRLPEQTRLPEHLRRQPEGDPVIISTGLGLSRRGAAFLPLAPAIMVGEEIVVEGKDIDEATVTATIRRGLELSSRED